MLKKILKKLFNLFLIIALIIVVNIILENYILSRLAQNHYWSQFSFVQKVNKPVKIINKIEKVTLPQDKSIKEIVSQTNTAMVNILSLKTTTNSIKTKTKETKFKLLQNGTGVILTSDGLIIANKNSLVLGEDVNYKVLVFNGKSYTAKITWLDNFSNLVFLKLDNVNNLPVIALANSDDFMSGQKIIAISNKGKEYNNFLAEGNLETKDRTFNLSTSVVNSSEKLEGVFRLNLANTDDFDGGIVTNYKGEVAGLISSLKKNNQTEYLVIPSNKLKNIFEFYLNYQEDKKERARLGVSYLSINPSLVLSKQLPVNEGALIYSPSGRQGLAILKSSSADKAGIEVGDIIISVDNHLVNLDNPLSNIIAQYHQGERAKIIILRKKEKKELIVNF